MAAASCERPRRRRSAPGAAGIVFKLGAVALLTACWSAPAFAFCSKPVTPYCATDGELVGGYITAERCRVRVVDHLRQLEDYQNCLRALVIQTGKDMDKLKRLVDESPLAAPQADPPQG